MRFKESLYTACLKGESLKASSNFVHDAIAELHVLINKKSGQRITSYIQRTGANIICPVTCMVQVCIARKEGERHGHAYVRQVHEPEDESYAEGQSEPIESNLPF